MIEILKKARDKKVFRNIMINAFEEGIYEELKSAKDYKIVVYRYKRILCEDYGIGESYADYRKGPLRASA